MLHIHNFISGCKNICKKDLVKIFYICLLQFQMFLLSFWVNVKPVCMYCVLTECVNTCELAWLYARVFAPQLSIPVSFWIWSFLISALPLIAHVGECFLCSGELNSYSNNPSAFCKHLVVSLVLHEVFLLRLPKLGGMDTFFFLFFFFIAATVHVEHTQLSSTLSWWLLGWQPQSRAPATVEAPSWLCVTCLLSPFFQSMSVLHQCTLTCSVVHTVANSGECVCLVCLLCTYL